MTHPTQPVVQVNHVPGAVRMVQTLEPAPNGRGIVTVWYSVDGAVLRRDFTFLLDEGLVTSAAS